MVSGLPRAMHAPDGNASQAQPDRCTQGYLRRQLPVLGGGWAVGHEISRDHSPSTTPPLSSHVICCMYAGDQMVPGP